MSASLDVDVLLLASELSRLPADRLEAVRRIVAKLVNADGKVSWMAVDDEA